MSNKHYLLRVIKNDYSDIILEAQLDSSECNNIEFKESTADPLKFRGLFYGDTITYINNTPKLIDRNLPKFIPGVVELFSKYKYKPNKRGVPGYIFKPINRNFPQFIVYTKIKRKNTKNRLLTIQLGEWKSDSIFPRGELVRDLGDYDNIDAIELALLYYYDIYPSKTNFKINSLNKEYLEFSKDNIPENKTLIKSKIYSIDPEGCRDIDDAFSITKDEKSIFIDIHIADVYYLLKKNNLLDKVKNTTSVYLTNSILHMIDNNISTNYSSLIAKKLRPMITLSINWDTINNSYTYSFTKTIGKITKNYSYSNYPKWIDAYFPILENIFNKVTLNNIEISESHKFIEALMIIYNNLFTKYLISLNKRVIYRSQKLSDKKSIYTGELGRFLNILCSKSAEYTDDYNFHTSLNITNYTHATSPIRRIIDLVNQSIFYNDESFIDRFKLSNINSYSKKIKKFYRKANKIRLAKEIYVNNFKTIECYIYSFDGDKIDIYLPKYKFNIRQKLLDSRIKDKFKVEYSSNLVKIINIEDSSLIELPIGKKLEFKITGKPDIYNIENSIKINYN